MDASFELLGLTGYRLGLCAAAGTIALFAVMLLLATKRLIKAEAVCVLTLTATALGVLLARALYCLVNLSYFLEAYENPWLMLRFFDGGLSLSGLLLGMLLAVPLTAAITKQKAAELLDILCVPMGLLFCALYLGQQDTGLGIGRIVQEGMVTERMPWLFLSERMGVNVEYRMLVYLYQAILSLLIALAMIPLYLHRQRKQGFRSGESALVALALYGACMAVLESLRDDGHMLIIFLRIGQVVAALLPVAAVFVLAGRYRRLHGSPVVMSTLAWIAILVYIGGIVLLEFALDGRLALLKAGAGVYYAIMILLSLLMIALVWRLSSLTIRERSRIDRGVVQ